MQTLSVALDERSYPIHIGAGLLGGGLKDLIGPLQGTRIALFTNPTVEALYAEKVLDALPHFDIETFLMKDGEAHKSLSTYAEAMDFLMNRRFNRTACLIALGGGVVGDLTGFVAATFQRGIDFVQIPTTLLAQVDSSVGGKTAVNHPSGKNMIGAFHQPQSVIIDTEVLQSLPAREYAAGLAEVVKYGVIADADFFAWIEAHVDELKELDPDALSHVVRRSCEIKAEVVAKDEREAGVRAILNYGHTFAHAIENLSGYGSWLHGEAVATGMLMAAEFSEGLKLLPQGSAGRIENLLGMLNLPVKLGTDVSAKAMLEAMAIDKKAVDGKMRFVVAHKIGHAQLTDEYDETVLRRVLQSFCHG